MDRYLGGQFPYAPFFWPALVAASAAETASSIAAHFLEFSGDAAGDRTPQEPEGATPSKIALDLHAVRLRDFTMAQSGVPTLLCTPLALHGAAITYFSLSDLSKFSAALPVAIYRACTSLFARRRNMVQIYYHCSTTEGVLIDRCGTAADD